MIPALLLGICLQVVAPTSRSDELTLDREINERLARVVESSGCPGIVAAIVEGDRILAIGAAGRRSAADPTPITIHDQVHLGSCTKAMTATLVGILVDEGKLAWDSRFIEVVPSLRDEIDPAYHEITLERLLIHRAGVPTNARRWWLASELPVHEARMKIVADTLGQPPAKKPAGEFLYSNLGYMMAGLMVEEVTGQSWEQVITEKLFGPLEMSSAGFGPPGNPDRLDQPRGHRKQGKTFRPVFLDNAPALGPAGTVYCNLADWARFAMLHNGHALEAGLIRPETLRRLQRKPARGDYACGWNVVQRNWAGGRALTHQGSNTYWTAIAWLAPERDFAILIGANANSPEITKQLDRMVGDLIRLRTLRSQ